MSLSTWGPPTWIFLHTLAEKVKDNSYHEIKNSLILFIIRICKNLPCPTCATHATQILSRANFSNIKTKNDLKNVLYMMHNAVNRQKNKPIFEYANLENCYSNRNLLNCYNNFISVYQTRGNMSLLTDSLHRKLLTSQLKVWMQSNINKFNI